MFAKLPEEDLWFLNHDVSDPEMIGDWIADLDTGRVVSIAAVLEGRIIGNAVLMRKRYGAKSHIGKLRISVEPRFRDRGLAEVAGEGVAEGVVIVTDEAYGLPTDTQIRVVGG